MRHCLADKTYNSIGQMLILMFDFIHGNAVIIFTEKIPSLVVAFLMILCVKRPSQLIKAGYGSILAGGIVLVEVAILNVTVLGTSITERSIFPLLSTFANVQHCPSSIFIHYLFMFSLVCSF
ncbi:hypothetical protein KAI37_04919 [Paenibacillus sp. S25]|uniref:hypothetical protein n=1 Tax=Paenibacillus sp. DRB1-1 TaxID=3422309 RepID=UPI003F9C9568|nr:hypothetical protein KAI37_04919 [Paenibacillus sp. S25]